MTDWKLSEQTANKFYARDVAKRAALKAAGGLASDKTLRDEFAGQALAGLASINFDEPADRFASDAYELADAMLEARKTQRGTKHD